MLVSNVCDECGISKELLKSEIISDLLSLFKGIDKGDSSPSVSGSHCPSPNLGAFITESHALLADFQRQIDFNHAQMEQAKIIYRNEVDHLYQLHHSLENDLIKLSDTVSEFNKSIGKIHEELEVLTNDVENGEMYTRRNTIEIHGVPETKNEITNNIALDIFRDMGLNNVTFKDICRSHRTKRGSSKRKNQPRPIYVKLVNHDLKDMIMQRKNRLRSVPHRRFVFINEDLTQLRRWLFGKARLQAGKNNCYTYDGVIFVKVFDNEDSFVTKQITTCRDFVKVFDVRPKDVN